MKNKKNGGPAFPLASAGGSMNEGMSRRDFFAGKALQGLCANPALVFSENPEQSLGSESATDDKIISYCTRLADKLIAELDRA